LLEKAQPAITLSARRVETIAEAGGDGGLIYRHDQRLEISRERGVLLHKLRGGVAEFRQRLWAQLIAAGGRDSDQLVVLGDARSVD
jgi:hypothetical protein